VARIDWDTVAPHVRSGIEGIAGAAVVAVTPVTGGFSPCFAGRLDLADGRAVFAKAVSAEQNPESPAYLRKELVGTAHVPTTVAAPRLLGTVDDADGGWIAGVFTFEAGTLPRTPWRPDELTRATRAVAAANATQASVELSPVGPHLANLFDGWRSLGDDAPRRYRELEVHAADAAAGDRLVHLDVRADNLLLTDDDVVIVDWAHVGRGAGWLDIVLWAPARQLEGGGTPEQALDAWPGPTPSHDALLPVVAGLAGYMAHRGSLPDPPGLPTLRAFQRAQAAPAIAWLERLLGA
jgi:hypothetical protein